MSSVSPETLQHTIVEFQSANPGSLLVGSLGRAAYFHSIGDPEFEFRSLGQDPLIRAKATWRSPAETRDVDFLTPDADGGYIPGVFEVDTACFKKEDVKICKEDEKDEWWVVSELFDRKVRLDPSVMKPSQMRTIYDIPCEVPPIETLYSLLGATRLRRKDQLAREMLEDKFPEEVQMALTAKEFEPFRDIHDIVSKGLFGQISSVYRTVLPSAVRKQIRPFLVPVRFAVHRATTTDKA